MESKQMCMTQAYSIKIPWNDPLCITSRRMEMKKAEEKTFCYEIWLNRSHFPLGGTAKSYF